MLFLLCQELFYFSFLLSVSEPLSLTSQPVQIITSAFHCQELFSFSTVVCSRALLPYGLAAGSFLWSASATSGILSRAEGIVNVFSVFCFFRTIQAIRFYLFPFTESRNAPLLLRTLHIRLLLHHNISGSAHLEYIAQSTLYELPLNIAPIS